MERKVVSVNCWKDKTDFEINKLVGECLGLDLSGITEEINLMYDSVKDYCNDPSRAWPIITDNKISLMNDGDTWEASIDFDGELLVHGTDETLSEYYEDKNPLRAAMIVYLEINGVKP